MFKQAPRLGFRKTHCHRRESRVTTLFFSFQANSFEELKSRGVPFSSFPVEVRRQLMIQSFTGLENKAV